MGKFTRQRDAIVDELFGAVSPVRLAERLNVTPQALYQWKQVPARAVLVAEEMSGIPCWRIRPDLYRAPEPAQ